MRRTIILLTLFLLLGGGVLWYLNNREDEKTTLAGADRRFAVEDISQVHRIFIADREGNRTTLERKDGYWLYNGQHKARPEAMEPLLQAIQRLRVKYKPPRASEKNMVEALATQGLKIELYDKQGRKIKSYYLGGSTADERGAFAIIDGAEQPYVVELPAWEGNVTVRFAHKGDDWRDKKLFAEEADNVLSVSIEYPRQRDHSFRLESTPDGFEVKPMFDVTPLISRPYREGSVETFLANFEALSAEEFVNRHPARDSVRQLVPFSIITLVNKQGDTTQARFFPILPDQYISQDIKSGEFIEASSDIERYYVSLNEKDLLLAQHLLLRKAFWSYSSFFQDRKMLN